MGLQKGDKEMEGLLAQAVAASGAQITRLKGRFNIKA